MQHKIVFRQPLCRNWDTQKFIGHVTWIRFIWCKYQYKSFIYRSNFLTSTICNSIQFPGYHIVKTLSSVLTGRYIFSLSISMQILVLYTWWYHDLETLSVLLSLCEGYTSVTGGFPSQRASDARPWCFIWVSLYKLMISRKAAALKYFDAHLRPLQWWTNQSICIIFIIWYFCCYCIQFQHYVSLHQMSNFKAYRMN